MVVYYTVHLLNRLFSLQHQSGRALLEKVLHLALPIIQRSHLALPVLPRVSTQLILSSLFLWHDHIPSLTPLFNMNIYNDCCCILLTSRVGDSKQNSSKGKASFFQLYAGTHTFLHYVVCLLFSDDCLFQGKQVQFVSTTPHRLRKRISGLVKSLQTGLVEYGKSWTASKIFFNIWLFDTFLKCNIPEFRSLTENFPPCFNARLYFILSVAWIMIKLELISRCNKNFWLALHYHFLTMLDVCFAFLFFSS